ncbi:MAG: hypothetical protein HOP15_18750, partial [Planctomycetes bacterium]|nr:hypothetical protein [Planctomycetota bacterium]
MIARTLALALVLPFAPAPLPFQQGSLSALVAGEVGSAGNMELDKLWQRAVELREAEARGEKGELDRVLDEWLAKGKELPPKAAILVSASRLVGSAPDVGRIAETLSPLV